MIKQPQRKPPTNQVKLSNWVGLDLGALASLPRLAHGEPQTGGQGLGDPVYAVFEQM